MDVQSGLQIWEAAKLSERPVRFLQSQLVLLAHENNVGGDLRFGLRRTFSMMIALAATALIRCARANLLSCAARIATLTAIVRW